MVELGLSYICSSVAHMYVAHTYFLDLGPRKSQARHSLSPHPTADNSVHRQLALDMVLYPPSYPQLQTAAATPHICVLISHDIE